MPADSTTVGVPSVANVDSERMAASSMGSVSVFLVIVLLASDGLLFSSVVLGTRAAHQPQRLRGYAGECVCVLE
jgi:hypothetical protein